MNTSQPQPNSLTDSDLELLSAYIDDQLDAPARAALERRLSAEPRLRADLDDLRATAALLRDLAPLPPPRSFTLDPARAPRRRSFLGLAWATQLGGGLAGLALVLLASVQLLLGPAGGAAMAPAPMAPAARQVLATEAVAAEAQAAAPFAIAETTATPAATMAPQAAMEMAPAATEAPLLASQSADTAGSPAAVESMASNTGADGGLQAAGAAPAPSPAPAPEPPAAILDGENPAPKAASPAPALLSSPAALLGLGGALLALALGAFFYRRATS